jgi:flagellar protein FlbD
MFINEDLIESIEATPDTVVTLVDGRKLVIADTPDEVVERARRYRASVLVAVGEMREERNADLILLNPGRDGEGRHLEGIDGLGELDEPDGPDGDTDWLGGQG